MKKGKNSTGLFLIRGRKKNSCSYSLGRSAADKKRYLSRKEDEGPRERGVCGRLLPSVPGKRRCSPRGKKGGVPYPRKRSSDGDCRRKGRASSRNGKRTNSSTREGTPLTIHDQQLAHEKSPAFEEEGTFGELSPLKEKAVPAQAVKEEASASPESLLFNSGGGEETVLCKGPTHPLREANQKGGKLPHKQFQVGKGGSPPQSGATILNRRVSRSKEGKGKITEARAL